MSRVMAVSGMSVSIAVSCMSVSRLSVACQCHVSVMAVSGISVSRLSVACQCHGCNSVKFSVIFETL